MGQRRRHHPQPAAPPASARTAAGTPSPRSRSGPTGGGSPSLAPSPRRPARSPRSSSASCCRRAPRCSVSQLSLEGAVGEEIDYRQRPARPRRHADPGRHAAARPTTSRSASTPPARWIDVAPDEGGPESRLFTAQVERLKATYTFNARSYLRLIGQYERTDSDPALYHAPVEERSGSFAGSALLAYKLNWQSVLFLGYGDDRALDDDGSLHRTGRQLFLKISYAFQR